jgi:hypothetical protein
MPHLSRLWAQSGLSHPEYLSRLWDLSDQLGHDHQLDLAAPANLEDQWGQLGQLRQ